MTTRPRQLLLDLPQRAALGRDDFLVTPSNEAAVRLVDQWPQWPTHGAILLGPEGSGKSHLAHVWQARSHARIIQADALQVEGLDQLFDGQALCIEDLQPRGVDQLALFHALNLAPQRQSHVLLTTRFEVAALDFTLPDLTSRLRALPVVSILAPDDTLLRGVLVKLFADKQISVDESIVNFILLRMPRSLAAARALVTEIDRVAMVEKAEVSRVFVSRVMAQMTSPDLFTTP
jgi:chromosomal replication initiation ATPase DnaA